MPNFTTVNNNQQVFWIDSWGISTPVYDRHEAYYMFTKMRRRRSCQVRLQFVSHRQRVITLEG